MKHDWMYMAFQPFFYCVSRKHCGSFVNLEIYATYVYERRHLRLGTKPGLQSGLMCWFVILCMLLCLWGRRAATIRHKLSM